MARIAGVDLPREKRIEVGLTYVYGIGQSTADEILAGLGSLSPVDVAPFLPRVAASVTASFSTGMLVT